MLYYQIQRFLLCTPASTTNAAAVNTNGIKSILANGLIIFFTNGNPVFSNAPRSLPINPADCIILNNWVFDSVISVDELFVKPLTIYV